MSFSSSHALRHARYISSFAATATAAASTAPTAANSAAGAALSISKVKSKLKSEYDPDKALEIYSSVASHYTSPLSSRYAQDLTIKRLAKSHRFADIETLIESHKNDPKITQEPFLATLIRSYGLAGMFDQALKTYNQMEELKTPRSAVSLNALLSACTRSKLYDQVPKLFEEMPQKYGFTPNQYSYGILIKSYCEAGSPELAVSKLKEMEENGVEITTVIYTTILHSLYKNGSNEEAERIWNEMGKKGCVLDVGAYNVRLMHFHGGGPEEVKRLIHEMCKAELKPDTISYNYLMTSYGRKNMMNEARKVYEGLEGYGCRPNAATFRTLIYYLCRNEQFEYGYKVFKESVRVNKIPDFNKLKHLLSGLVKKSEKKDAKGMIRTMKKKFPPNLLNAWKRLEEDLGLASPPEATTTGDDNKRESA